VGEKEGPTSVGRPWSDTRASYLSVSRTLEDLMLPCDAAGPAVWMCATPRAAASAIADRVSQSSGVRPEARLPATRDPRYHLHRFDVACNANSATRRKDFF
jgi:hypothetical protein